MSQIDIQIDPADNSLVQIINRTVNNLLNSADEKLCNYVQNPTMNTLINIAHEVIKTEFKEGNLTTSDKEHILSEVLTAIVKKYANNNTQLIDFVDETIIPTLLPLIEGVYNCVEKLEDCVIDQTKECCKDKCVRLKNWFCCSKSKQS